MDFEDPPYPERLQRLPTVNLSQQFSSGAFFNPAVFYGTPLYPNTQRGPTLKNINLPTPPQLPTPPNFSSPYFQQQQQEQEEEDYMNENIFDPTGPKKRMKDIKCRGELVDFLLSHGIDAIPVTDPPLLYNEILATKKGLIGTEHVALVVCQSNPDYETYVCKICEFWNTPGNMIEHLGTESHQLKHMRKKYKDQFHQIQISRKRNRQGLIDKFVRLISFVEPPKIVKRTRIILTLNILLQVWPKFVDEYDANWKNGGKPNDIEVIILDDTPADPEPKPSKKVNRPSIIEETKSPFLPAEELEEGEIISKTELKNSCLCALAFIRAEAFAKKSIDRKKDEKICALVGVTTEMAFSDEALEYAEKKIGSPEILVAIVEHWKNPAIPLSILFKKVGVDNSCPPEHPTTVLMELGVDKSKIAQLIRDVNMILKHSVQNKLVHPSTVFTRKPTKKCPLVNHFERAMVLYDGDYIEGQD